jgi:integrase
MRSTLHHLAQRGTAGTWYAIKQVPKDLRSHFGGKHHLIKSLQTTDRAIALARRNAALDEMEDAIHAARLPAKLGEVSEAAVTIARDQDQPRRSARDRFYDRIRDRIPVPDRRTVEELHDRYGPSVAQTFQGVAKGQATPLLHHVDTWLAEGGRKGPLSEKAKGQYRAALRRLKAWLLSTGRAVTIEAVDRQTAGLFISEMMINPGIDRVTANSWISPCSSYWKWLDKRMGVHTSPWQGQGFSKPQRRNGDENKRPFTDLELATLLTGRTKHPVVADYIRIAALTGMRRDEIAELRVKHSLPTYFDVVQSKTMNGVRRVPMHPDLKGIVGRLKAGKAPDDYLLPIDAQNRGDWIGKRVKAYMESLGVVDAIDGKRQDRLDVYSLKRWAVTKMRASFDQIVVVAVIGHERPDNVTDRHYTGRVDWQTCVACLESLRLPIPERKDEAQGSDLKRRLPPAEIIKAVRARERAARGLS